MQGMYETLCCDNYCELLKLLSQCGVPSLFDVVCNHSTLGEILQVMR